MGAGDERDRVLAGQPGRPGRGDGHLRRGRLRRARGQRLDARRPGRARALPVPGGPPRGALDGRPPARLRRRELRRRLLALLDRALRLAGRHRAARRPRSAGCCAREATPSWSPSAWCGCTRSTGPRWTSRSGSRRWGARTASPPSRRRQKVGEAFTPRELERRIVRPSGLRLMQPLDTALVAGVVGQPRPLPARVASRSRPRSGSFYPHILVQASRSVFTSACLPLQKPL